MDRFTALKTFCAVVETHSFARAAMETGLSRSAISKNIRELEMELGVSLIRRNTRGISVTEAGQAYYRCVRQILNNLHDATDIARQSSQLPSGTLKISAPMTMGLLSIIPLLPRFSQQYPDITLDVTLTDKKVELLHEGFDIAIRGSKKLVDSTMVCRQIGSINYVICASPDYLKRSYPLQKPEDLKHHEPLIYTGTNSPERWKFTVDDTELIVPVTGRHKSNNSLALREFALAGMGLLLVPELYVRQDLQEGRLITVLKEAKIEPLGLWVLYPQSEFMALRLRVLIDFLIENFESSKACRV